MKKRLLSILLIGVLSFSLCACGDPATEPTAQTEETEQQTTEEETDTQPTETEEPQETEENETPEKPETAEEVATEKTTTPEETTAEETETAETDTEQTAEAEQQYTYTDMSATMYATQTVNIRTAPSTDGEKVGSLSTNQEINITGQCNETKWFRFEYNGSTAYVSNNYVSDTKIEVAATEPAQSVSSSESSGGSTSNAGKEPCPYPLNKITTETTSYGMTVWVLYTTMPAESIWVVLRSGLSIENSSFMTDLDEQMSSPFAYAAGNEVYPILGGTDYGFHYVYPAGVKVGTYAEGTVYKFTAGVHAYIGTCPNGSIGCQPGTIN